MRGVRKFCQSGFNIFSVDEGREDPNTTINGQASAHQQNAI